MKKIIIIYDYFDPAFKAGGIIKSLKSIVDGLKDNYQFKIITSAFDLKQTETLTGIETNRWIKKEKYEIEYLTEGILTYISLFKDLIKFKNETIYLNGIFSFKFFIFPLFILQLFGKKEGLIIAPRGMVQTGALGLKKRKKKLYLAFLKKLPILKSVTWHATSSKEKDDLVSVLGIKNIVKSVVAQNISSSENSGSKPPLKVKNKANFTTVSLIVEMKNHIQFLKLLLKSKPDWDINYNIYGPIKDQEYWNDCLETIKLLPQNVKVKYHGFLNPVHLEKAYQENHFFVLPTKGENFGHAILESLTFGRPVLLSDKTPWNDLDKKGSGWIFKNDKEFFEILKTCVEMENNEYEDRSKAAAKHAEDFLAASNNVQAYSKLFN